MTKKNLFTEKETRTGLILCAAALVLLVLAFVFRAKMLPRTVLAVLSFLCSAASKRIECMRAAKEKDFRSGLWLLILACILCFCTGRDLSAALAMLLYAVGTVLLVRVRSGVERLMETRRGLSPLKDMLPESVKEVGPISRGERFFAAYLTYIAVLLAAFIAVLTVILWKESVSAALGRAAVVLALGGIYPLFAAFPLSDIAAVIRAAECGVLFRRDTLHRLMGLNLACVRAQEPTVIGSVRVYPARPDAVSAELMVRLASAAYADSAMPAAEKLAAVCTPREGTEALERKEFAGLGIAMSIKDVSVVCGSAEYMRKCGLNLIPFPEDDRLLHIGVNGHYVGLIEFVEDHQDIDPTAAWDKAGFFGFRSAEEAEEKRLTGEKVFFLRPAGGPLPGRLGDLSAVFGAGDREDQITVERCGPSAVPVLLSHLENARLGRKGILLVAVVVKLFALLLAVFGLCPLWLAVLLELVTVGFTYRYTIRLLDHDSRY